MSCGLEAEKRKRILELSCATIQQLSEITVVA